MIKYLVLGLLLLTGVAAAEIDMGDVVDVILDTSGIGEGMPCDEPTWLDAVGSDMPGDIELNLTENDSATIAYI